MCWDGDNGRGRGVPKLTSVLVVREDGGQHEQFKHDPHAPEDALRDVRFSNAIKILGLGIRALSADCGHGGLVRGRMAAGGTVGAGVGGEGAGLKVGLRWLETP